MTVLEALNIEVGNIDLSEKYLLLQGLNTFDDFSTDNSGSVELAKAYCFRAKVAEADFSEDGLSITINRPALIAEANRIFTANGLTEELIGSSPTLKSATGRW